MKKITLLLLVLTFVLFYSCKSDDEDTNQDATLVGTWKLTAFTTGATSDINQDGNSTNNFLAETNNCYADGTLVFKTDNTVDSSGSYATINISNTTGTLTITTTCDNDGTVETNNWTQSGNNITVTDVGTGTLSGNTLTFTIPSGYDLPSIDSGVEAHTLTDITQVFTKQ